MVLQVAFLGGGVLAQGAEELTRIQVEFHVLLEVAAICRLVLTVRAGQRFGAVVDLAGVAGHLVLVGRQVVTALALEWTLTCAQEDEQESGQCGGQREAENGVRVHAAESEQQITHGTKHILVCFFLLHELTSHNLLQCYW